MRSIVLVITIGLGATAVAQESNVILRKVSSHSKTVTFDLSNDSRRDIAYFHWFGDGASPVAYCKNESGEIRICATRATVTPEGEPWTHEAYLQPGKRVRFKALPGASERVGVRLWIDHSE